MGAMGRPCLICQPSSRTGENPPYGMIGGTVETSASFEARYAPLSYPTAGGDPRWSSLPRQLRSECRQLPCSSSTAPNPAIFQAGFYLVDKRDERCALIEGHGPCDEA